MTPDELAAIREAIARKPWDFPFGVELLALVDTLTERAEEAGRRFQFAAVTGDQIAAELLRVSAERDALRAQMERVEVLARNWHAVFPASDHSEAARRTRIQAAAILRALAEPAAEGGEQHPITLPDAPVDRAPLYCTTCGGAIVIEGYPERTDGGWIHLRDVRAAEGGEQ